jgi:hypothetical protein
MIGRVLAGILIWSGLLLATVYSCSPPPETPLCQFPTKIDITFVGTAVATNYDPTPPGGSDLAFFKMWYRFSVKEAFTGLRPEEKEVVVWLSLGGGSPQIGRAFFVHAERRGNEIRLASCGNTRPIEDAGSDIEYLRELRERQFKPFIAGSVLRHYEGSQYEVETHLDGSFRGLAGARIEIKNALGTTTLTADAKGRFRAENVVPGKYVLTAESPGYRLKQPYAVEVPQDGCGIAHMGMQTNGGISGIVRRVDGTPAKNVELDLIDAEDGYRSITTKLKMIKTGLHGEFSIDHLPSGRFLLGVNIEECERYPDQTPPTYYPGVATRSDATVIELQPDERKPGLVLTELPPRAFRVVRVHLVWPDGKVPARGVIDAWANRGIYVSKYDLKDGIFELNVLQGVDYWLTAAALDESRKPTPFAGGTWVYADNYHLAAGSDPADITLTAHFPEPQWAKAIYSRPKIDSRTPSSHSVR